MGLVEVAARRLDELGAGAVEPRARNNGGWIGGFDAGVDQGLLRQIKASDLRILVKVTQNIGELQRAPQMMGKLPARLCLKAEDFHRQPTDRARHPITIQVEGGP